VAAAAASVAGDDMNRPRQRRGAARRGLARSRRRRGVALPRRRRDAAHPRRRRVHRQPHGAAAAPAGLPRRRHRQPRQCLTPRRRPSRRDRQTQRRKPCLPQGVYILPF
jgi:hypothetical protein